MSLNIRQEKGINKPIINCDHCGERIDDARLGNYQWKVDAKGQPFDDGPVYFTHKDCCQSFETANGGRRIWFWAPLTCLPAYLLNNLQLAWDEANEDAEMMSCL